MGKILACLTIVLLQLAGCATQTGKGFDLTDDNDYSQALPHFERAAKEHNSKVSAVMASFLYLSDYQIPRNLDKAKEYYELAKDLDYDRYDQYLDYFIPLANARILLYDDDLENDIEATNILRGDRYSEYSGSLGLLAKTYAFGKGVEKNIKISKLLFERAVEHDDYVSAAHHYAWWLSVHPDPDFRDGERAMELISLVMEDKEDAGRATTIDTYAAALAEKGDFKAAIQKQNLAISLLKKESEKYSDFKLWMSWYECRLHAYENGSAWMSSEMPFYGTRSPESEEHYCNG